MNLAFQMCRYMYVQYIGNIILPIRILMSADSDCGEMGKRKKGPFIKEREGRGKIRINENKVV